VARSEQAQRSDPGAWHLAAEALHVAAEAGAVGSAGGQVIPFGLSASMARHGAGAEDVVDAILEARAAVIATSGIDPATEPVPLVVGDARVAAVNLGVYLQGLLERAAARSRTDRVTVSVRTMARLRAG